MIMNVRSPLALAAVLACAAAGGALSPVFAQGKAAPAPASEAAKAKKTPQDELNRLKQDARNTKTLDEALEHLKQVARSNEAADKGMERLNTDRLKDLKDIKSLEDAKAKAKEIEGSLSPEDRAKLDKVKESMGAKAREMVDGERKKRAAETPAAKPDGVTLPAAPAGPPPAATFDSVPAPKAVAGVKAPKKDIKDGYGIVGDVMILPISKDPGDPSKPLPAADLRSRTMIAKGNVHVRTENLALDADRVDAILPPNGSGGLMGAGSGVTTAPKAKKADPVNPDAGDTESGDLPFERVIATGRVSVARYDAKGILQTGKGGRMTYDKASGNVILEDWPEAQHGDQVLVAIRKDAKIVMNPDKAMQSDGCKFIEAAGKKTAAPPAAPAPAAAPVPAAR